MGERRRYTLPSGTTTTSPARYTKAWRELARPIAKAMKAHPYGYEPGIEFQREVGGRFDVPTDLAIMFYKLATGKDFGEIE